VAVPIADRLTDTRAEARADRPDDRPSWVAPYTAILGSRLRSQLQYRTSFGIELVSNIGVGAVQLAEVYVVFHNVRLLGGLDVNAALLVFALSNLGFGLADLVTGNLDQINEALRLGTFDVLMVRPLPVLAQLVLADVTLKRMGRGLLALMVLALALTRVHVSWTWRCCWSPR
jgi:ABC-2 type transport system permease protein